MHNNSRGFAVVIIILLVLALIGSVGYIVYQNSQPEKTVQIDKSEPSFLSPSPHITSSPSPTIDPMSTWKTYSSNTYKVSYPPDMDVKELEGNTLALSMWGPTQKADTEFYDGISLSFTPQEVPNTTLQSYVQAKIDEINDVGISTILSGPDPVTINGYKGLTYTEQGLGTFKTTVIESKDGVMFMEITNSTVDPGNLGFNKIVDQILTTFEFVE